MRNDTAQALEPIDLDNKEALRGLVGQCLGNRSRMARELDRRGQPLSRQAISVRLERAGLLVEADRLSAGDRKRGPRRNLPKVDGSKEKAAILKALSEVDRYADAPAKLAMTHATFYRRLHDYGITRAMVKRSRAAAAGRTARR